MSALQVPTLGTSSTIGRYFGIVSVVPSLVLALWVYLLLVMRPWAGPPDIAALALTNPVEKPAHAVALVLAALVVAVVSHPLQFTVVQLLEGYWGFSPLGRALASRRILAQLRARNRAKSASDSSLERTESYPQPLAVSLIGESLYDDGPARGLVEVLVENTSANAVLARYPSRLEHVLPTRLGNTLRGYETLAGKAVGLDLLKWASHIGMVAEPADTAYVQDQRSQMDLAVRMTAVGILCSALTCGLLWPHGSWLTLALVPLTAAWLSYRGALSAADSYGQALVAWLDLNRFRLYERLGLPRPKDSDDERVQAKHLRVMLAGSQRYKQPYRPTDPA